jgi:uncharacterized phage protein (TIGR01671 family)
MKREIKFRAWLEGTHGNITFQKGSMDYGITISEKGFYCDIEGGWDIQGTIDTVPIMQFTGLKDIKGREIYTCDILSDKWKVQVYQNNEGTFMIKFNTNPKINKPISLQKYLKAREKAGTSDRDCRLIGNIYENPELLEGSVVA